MNPAFPAATSLPGYSRPAAQDACVRETRATFPSHGDEPMTMQLRTLAATALLASLALAGCATTSPGSYAGSSPSYGSTTCYDCGTVQSIENVGHTPNATGAVLGGLVGAAAAREVAKDRTD